MHVVTWRFLLAYIGKRNVKKKSEGVCMQRKVALIFGGRSLEKEISIITAMQVLKNIDKSKFKVEPVYVDDGNFYVGDVDDIKQFTPFNPSLHEKAYLIKGEFFKFKRGKLVKVFKPDVAFLCCHGGEGENGTLQGIMEFNGIAYTSCGVLASACCMDKVFSKSVFSSLLLNVLPYETVMKADFEKDRQGAVEWLKAVLDYPIIVKPSSSGSSIGIAVAHDDESLLDALDVAFGFDDKAIAEKKLSDFKEVNCAAFEENGKIVLSNTERPCTASEFLTFDDKYARSEKARVSERIMPADIGSLELIVKANTERVYKEMGLFGVVRVDYLVDEKRKKVYINEINTIPGSMAFYLFDMPFSSLIERLVEQAILRKARLVKPIFQTGILASFKGGAKMIK